MDWNQLYVSSLGDVAPNSNQSAVVNLFKLSQDCTYPDDNRKPSKGNHSLAKKPRIPLVKKAKERSNVDYRKDFHLWKTDKGAFVEMLNNRAKLNKHTRSQSLRPQNSDQTQENLPVANTTHETDVAMSNESEILLTWMDKYICDSERITDDAQKIFVENAAKLLAKAGIGPMNFLNFMIDIGKLAYNKTPNFLQKYLRLSLKNLQRQAWGSLHLSILNSKGVFMESLVLRDNTTTLEVLKAFVDCANLVFNVGRNYSDGLLCPNDQDYYFFLAYLLFRTGSHQGLNVLCSDKQYVKEKLAIDFNKYPPLFDEMVQILRDTLLEKPMESKQFLISKFALEYPLSNVRGHREGSKDPKYYVHLLLSLVYPDHYPEMDPSTMATKEDYLWYQLNLTLEHTGGSLVLAAQHLCSTISAQVNDISARDPNVLEQTFAYAYAIALGGGIMEALRLLLSANKSPEVQLFVALFVVLYENVGLFDIEEINHIGLMLWNVKERNKTTSEDLSYLTLLAFHSKRNLTAEMKILLATMMPSSKAMNAVKYALSESFNEAVKPTYLGSSGTKHGMLVVGPLLQKLVKISPKRNAAKYAMMLLAQYAAHLGMWAIAFKCFYCIQDVENCASVLEACCCSLFDKSEPEKVKMFTMEDLIVYYNLVKSLAPNNRHVLGLKNVFHCLELCNFVKEGRYLEAVHMCSRLKLFENTVNTMRTESHQIYFNALCSYIAGLNFLVKNGRQPSEFLTPVEANNLLDLLEAAYQNTNTDKHQAVDALHILLSFISVVPSRSRY